MQSIIVLLLDGLAGAAWLFLISLGLTLVFGVLRLLNIAHGGLYSFGAYTAAYAIGATASLGAGLGAQILAAAALAVMVGAALGILLERGVVSRLYSLPEGQVLFATYALFLILEDLTKWIWGGQPLNASGPRDALGQLSVGGLQYPTYDIALIVLACLLATGVWLVLTKTSSGRCVTAVVVDREMSASMGINVRRVMTLTFAAGAALGAFVGAAAAPKISIGPGLGVEVIVQAFAVTVIGGLGSIGGALVAALLVGMAQAIAAHVLPEASIFVVYAAMASVLAIRPHGIFAPQEARKI